MFPRILGMGETAQPVMKKGFVHHDSAETKGVGKQQQGRC